MTRAGRSRGAAAMSVMVAVGVAACSGGGSRAADLPAPGMCAPVEGALGSQATLASHDGSYALTLVSSDGSRTEGTLELRARPADRRTRGGTATPLDGTADIDLAAAGAQAVPGLSSRDPAAPGVLVLESGDDGSRTVTVRFGSVSNREGDSAIDAAFTVLDVTRIGDAGFFGDWRSGVRTERAAGYFCAWPRGD